MIFGISGLLAWIFPEFWKSPQISITHYTVSPAKVGKRIGVHLTIMNNGPSLPTFVSYTRRVTPSLADDYPKRKKFEDDLWEAEQQVTGHQTLLTLPAGASNIDMESENDLTADSAFVWYFAMAVQDEHHKTVLQSCFYIDQAGTKNTVTFCIGHNK